MKPCKIKTKLVNFFKRSFYCNFGDWPFVGQIVNGIIALRSAYKKLSIVPSGKPVATKVTRGPMGPMGPMGPIVPRTKGPMGPQMPTGQS